ncbi:MULTISPECIES: NUMOD4 domain-containing protein [unclassified Mammaliicoccus]|uniref:NUMOD4 domain-containing protein n=1 Tax=unclassified Mammaliicoccus TaxID=2803851 RepID=UPI001EFAE47F|nr:MULTISPECIES: NUMOD4 domain-containing protein [unclassified Mammaliicoccus]
MENVEVEIWKNIPDFEGYQASNLGRIKSLHKMLIYKNNRVRFTKEMILKPSLDEYSRPKVVLCKNKKSYNKKVCNLVMSAFVSEKPEGYHSCHLNGNSQDNRLINLRYDTASENSIDFYRYGKKNNMGKLSIEQVLEIRKSFAAGEATRKELSKMFNVKPCTISKIVNRKSFDWLNSDGSIAKSKTAIRATV